MWHEERCLTTGNHDAEIELYLNVCHRIESFEILGQETCSDQVPSGNAVTGEVESWYGKFPERELPGLRL